MDDLGELFVTLVLLIILFGLGVFIGYINAKPTETHDSQVVCEYLKGKWHTDTCIVDGKEVKISLKTP